ncbi:MAG: ribosomal protein [Candidatus Saccharibacteria bacterium]|nr:ribosomal protein [Candidatus Saccharibacteria bacterium]
MKDLMLIPRISEKAYAMSQRDNIKTYVFEVPTGSNKHSVARAVTMQFDVVVTSVRTTTAKGKVKQSYRKGGRPITGTRSDVKKAYVTLREGDVLPLFIEEQQEEEKQLKADQKAAKEAKKAKKETK